MALFAPSESPAVVVREIDLTGGVPNVQSTTGAFVGEFTAGPVNKRVLINNEEELVATFGSPTDSNAVDFLTCTQFLRYSGSLYVTRVLGSGALNAADAASGTPVSIPDQDTFTNNLSGFTGQVFARETGTLGNSLAVKYWRGDSVGANFSTWAYSGSFNGAPATSFSVNAKGSEGDEFHVVVVDSDGEITGTKGTVLETFEDLSVLADAKDYQGVSQFAREVVNNTSQYIYLKDITALNNFGDTSALNTVYWQEDSDNLVLEGGSVGSATNLSAIQTGWDLYEDKDQVEIDFMLARDMADSDNQVSLVNDLVATARSIRKDCVVVTSPPSTTIVGVTNDATKVSNIISQTNRYTKSSYLVVDGNYLKVYDKFNDKYRFIPASSTVAGCMALTDLNRAAWFSPAGERRGQMLGITSLAFSPTKGQRDQLYKAGVNPIANIPGKGALLFGDKTKLGRISAFDRINVRRLFLILERAIGRAAESVLFELNDEFTRAEFVNIVEPVLREVQGRRGITDFRVVCDETNNTPAVVDRNEFKADIFIKPARSINYVTLTFVAVRTGVDFEEVVGTV
jgi:phage tail sheath protein FI